MTGGGIGAVLVAVMLVAAGATSVGAAQTKCRGQNATITGTEGDDRLTGTSGDDVIVGLGGDDVIETQGGTDRVCGNRGDDTLRRLVEETIDDDDVALFSGGAGHDVLEGGANKDDPAAAEVLRGGPGHDRISGFAGPDQLYGNTGNDVLDGGDGHDYTEGGDGRDECRNEEWKVGCER